MDSASLNLYNRRRTQFTRSRSYYLNRSISSRDSLDDDTTDDCDSTSITSTKSQKSFKSWKRAQRNKRKKKITRTHSLINTLDLKIKRVSSTSSDIYQDRKDNILLHADSEELVTPSRERLTRLSTITQSPAEIDVYYSSSPLTTSSDDSDVETSLKANHRGQYFRKNRFSKLDQLAPRIPSLKEDNEQPGLNSIFSILSDKSVKPTNIMSAADRHIENSPEHNGIESFERNGRINAEAEINEITVEQPEQHETENTNIERIELLSNSSQELSNELINLTNSNDEITEPFTPDTSELLTTATPSTSKDLTSTIEDCSSLKYSIESPSRDNYHVMEEQYNEPQVIAVERKRCDLNSNVEASDEIKMHMDLDEDLDESVFENVYLENSNSLRNLKEDSFYDDQDLLKNTSSPKESLPKAGDILLSSTEGDEDPIENVLVCNNTAKLEASTFTKTCDDAKVTSLRRRISPTTISSTTSPSKSIEVDNVEIDKGTHVDEKDQLLQSKELTSSQNANVPPIHGGVFDCCAIL